MSEVLKGNFKTKKKVEVEDAVRPEEKKDGKTKTGEELEAERRERALVSIGGSMVYIEKSKLSWDGDT